MSGHGRRDVLKYAAAGATTLTVVGNVGASSGRKSYVVSTVGGGVARRLERAGFDVTRSLAGGDVLLVEGSGDPSSVRGVGEVVENFKLRREPVAMDASGSAAETEDESLFGLQWDKMTTDAPTAHETSTGDGASIAIIDSGVDLDHPDLMSNLVPGAMFRLGDVLGAAEPFGVHVDEDIPVRRPAAPLSMLSQVEDEDGNGVGYRPVDFEVVTQDGEDDVDGHGSHVAGIAAATVGEQTVPGFGTGVAGMAPDASIVPHRVFYWIEEEVTYDDGYGNEVTETLVNLFTTFADILSAIDFAANEVGVDVMNLSIGTSPLPPQLNSFGIRKTTNLVVRDAVNAGSVVVISAGNSATELNKGGLFTLPNSVPGAMSIAATGPNDELVFYSNSGANEITIGAPGGGYETLEKTLATDTDWPFPLNLVLSTVPPDVYGGPGYAYFAGTSMAAPQVAGVAALVASANRNLSVQQVERAIVQGAEKATGLKKRDVGAGVLNAAGAVDQA